MTDLSTTDHDPSTPASRTAPTRRRAARRWWRRKPVNRAMVVTHRWPALILGLLLVIESTSGAILLYHGEYFRATNSNLYQHTAGDNPITPDQAIDIVDKAHPNFGAMWVAKDDGVYAVGEATYANQYFVDPGTGRINGLGSDNTGFMALLVNVHDCAFTCEGYPLYSETLAQPIWTNGPSFLTGVTWASLILGVLGVLMILLALTSLRIWWPGIKRLKTRFVVRKGKGRFARDYDLHNVVGAIALPFVLMWGITGAAFEFPVVEKVWLAITAGDQPVEEDFSITPNAAAKDNPMLSTAQATDIALAEVPGEATFIGRPTKDTPFYEIDIVSGYGAYQHRAIYSGDAYVLIDPHDASNLKVLDNGAASGPNRFYDKFLEPTHFGWNVNAWWRLIWLVLGLAPLALMVTGVSTWLYRRGIKKRRKRAGEKPLPAAALDPDQLERDGAPDLLDIDPAEDGHDPLDQLSDDLEAADK